MRAVGSQDQIGDLARAPLAHVEHQRALGLTGVPPAAHAPSSIVAPATRTTTGTPVAPPMVADATPTPGGCGTLEELRADIGDCRRCKLAPHRRNLVFGVGNPNARLVFVGEAPGADEDAKGEPFVGRAGQLLTEIITKGMKLRREDVYICNVIKCRPPGNRNPEPDEVAACEPFLLRQLELIGPEVIVALGKFAAQTLLRDDT